jgi:hypothetical protein
LLGALTTALFLTLAMTLFVTLAMALLVTLEMALFLLARPSGDRGARLQ